MAKTSGVVEVSNPHRTEVFMSHRNARLTEAGMRVPSAGGYGTDPISANLPRMAFDLGLS